MSNCCMRRPAKFHVDSTVRFWAIANIREGGRQTPPPPVKRGLNKFMCKYHVRDIWVIPREVAQENPRPPSILMKIDKPIVPQYRNMYAQF